MTSCTKRPSATCPMLTLWLLATISCTKAAHVRNTEVIDASRPSATGVDAAIVDARVADARPPRNPTPTDAGAHTAPTSAWPPTTTVGSTKDVQTNLPPLPEISNVVATVLDDSVEISFAAVTDARDYRVYSLPKVEDVSSVADGRVTVKNALYRCAGDRQTSKTVVDSKGMVQGHNIASLVDGVDVDGYTRTLGESTLGYVYDAPGAGRIPVYVLGDSAPNADVDCEFMGGMDRWQWSLSAKYTTSPQERQALLANRWRDDGVAFYVPDTTTPASRSVYLRDGGTDKPRLYFVDGAEAAVRDSPVIAFSVLGAPAAGTVPLKRVHYFNLCGQSHDVLVPGEALFQRARYQGDQAPVTHLHWAGVSEPTTLVIEALADGCPYQGFLSPVSVPAMDTYPRWFTLTELKQASATGEVYINGQHDTTQTPRPIARAFVKVSPGKKPAMDWFEGFSASNATGALQEASCGVDNCWASHRRISSLMDVSFLLVENDRFAMTQQLGELWIAYADVDADVNGKFRLTPSARATLSDSTFLHATMTIDTFTTARRYPQIIITEQEVPVQLTMGKGYALVFQTFGGWPNTFELQVCDHQTWEVNNQCPRFDSHHVSDANDPKKYTGLLPHPVPGEHSGLDRGTRLDVYASTKRAYWFMDGEPYACADLPARTVPAGKVTVTFGDVLYHSGADALFTYTTKALQLSTRRHFDNLGFSSAVPAPAWDEVRFPCAKALGP